MVHSRMRQTPLASGPSKSSAATCRAGTWLGAERSWRVLRATSPNGCAGEFCPDAKDAVQPKHVMNNVPARIVLIDRFMAIATNSAKLYTRLRRRRRDLRARCIPPETVRPGSERPDSERAGSRSEPVLQSTIFLVLAGSG